MNKLILSIFVWSSVVWAQTPALKWKETRKIFNDEDH